MRSGSCSANRATRQCASKARSRLRGERVLTSAGRALEVDIVASPWIEGGILLEIHRLTSAQASPTPARLSESLRGLAHEVKNPLAGVRGAAQLLKRRLADPELAHLADLIIGEADRLVDAGRPTAAWRAANRIWRQSTCMR